VQGPIVEQDLAEGLEMGFAILSAGGLQRYFLARRKEIHGVSLSGMVSSLGSLRNGV